MGLLLDQVHGLVSSSHFADDFCDLVYYTARLIN